MAYKPNPIAPIRDKTYPGEVAAQRPALATRIHCEESIEEMQETRVASIRGDRSGQSYLDGDEHADAESPSERFNRQLREGR